MHKRTIAHKHANALTHKHKNNKHAKRILTLKHTHTYTHTHTHTHKHSQTNQIIHKYTETLAWIGTHTDNHSDRHSFQRAKNVVTKHEDGKMKNRENFEAFVGEFVENVREDADERTSETLRIKLETLREKIKRSKNDD